MQLVCVNNCSFFTLKVLKLLRIFVSVTVWVYVNAGLVLLQSLELSDTEVGNNGLQHLSGLS
jgi:hypothetical protein